MVEFEAERAGLEAERARLEARVVELEEVVGEKGGEEEEVKVEEVEEEVDREVERLMEQVGKMTAELELKEYEIYEAEVEKERLERKKGELEVHVQRLEHGILEVHGALNDDAGGEEEGEGAKMTLRDLVGLIAKRRAADSETAPDIAHSAVVHDVHGSGDRFRHVIRSVLDGLRSELADDAVEAHAVLDHVAAALEAHGRGSGEEEWEVTRGGEDPAIEAQKMRELLDDFAKLSVTTADLQRALEETRLALDEKSEVARVLGKQVDAVVQAYAESQGLEVEQVYDWVAGIV